MNKYLLNGFLFYALMAPEPAAGGGGGGAPTPDPVKDLADSKAAHDALKKEFDDFKAKHAAPKPDLKDDAGLIEKAKLEQDKKDKEKDHTKHLESALRFTMTAKDWAKTHASILPKDIEGIFAEAEKENYDSALEKSSAIKSALVQSFFTQQANLDLLTPNQKSSIEDFLKLTKNAKQDKAAAIYDSVFEPTIEMLKRLRKAEQLRADGHSTGTDGDKAYKEKMQKLSRQHYMGEKA